MRNCVLRERASLEEFENYPIERDLYTKVEAAESLLGSEKDDFTGVPNADYDFRAGDEVDMDKPKPVMNVLELGLVGAKGIEDRFQRMGFCASESADITE